MPVGRGSSTSSGALAEAIRRGTSPSAIVLPEADQVLAVGSIVARDRYGVTCPLQVAEPDDLKAIRTGDPVTINRDGSFLIESA